MTSFEKAEIRRLPKQYRPMGLLGYVWNTLLYIIPVLGLVFLISGACSDKNVSRRTYARSFLFILLLCAAIGFVYIVALSALGLFEIDALVNPIANPIKKLLGK